MNYTYPTLDKFYIKVLDFFEKHPRSSLKEMYSIAFPSKNFGSCINEINKIRKDRLIVQDGKIGRSMVFSISDSGKNLLKQAFKFKKYSDVINVLQEHHRSFAEYSIYSTLMGYSPHDIDFFKNIKNTNYFSDKIAKHLCNKILKYTYHWDEMKSF